MGCGVKIVQFFVYHGLVGAYSYNNQTEKLQNVLDILQLSQSVSVSEPWSLKLNTKSLGAINREGGFITEFMV